MTTTITLTLTLSVIENPAYLIAPGTYLLGVHRWTKTQQLVPILRSVPATPDYPSYEGNRQGWRSGILIHQGTCEEHSHGCLLAPQAVVGAIVTLIQHSDEEVRLSIRCAARV